MSHTESKTLSPSESGPQDAAMGHAVRGHARPRRGGRIVALACLIAAGSVLALPLWREEARLDAQDGQRAAAAPLVRNGSQTAPAGTSGRSASPQRGAAVNAAAPSPRAVDETRFVFLAGPAVDGAQLTAGPIARPAEFFRAATTSTAGVSVKDFGARGDGIADDTAAIQAALNATRTNPDGTPNQPSPDDYNGRPRFVYLPAGTYKVSNTLRWVGCCLTFRGDGAGATTIRLVDGAPGFGNAATPKAVIQTESGNESFRQMVMDLAVDVGSRNPGAIGINYVSSNNGAMRNVLVRSTDGRGYAGLGMERSWTGPALIRDVEVRGFDHGVRVGPGEYGVTFEGLTLRGQRVAGILNRYGALNIRDLLSVNTVPALVGSEVQGHFALLDARLEGGAAGTSAVQTQSEAYLRNVTSTGYAQALSVRGTPVAGTTVVEHATRYHRAITGGTASLKLPYTDTPAGVSVPAAQWFRFPDAADYGNLRKLQGYLDSGTQTLYFPFGVYFSYNEVAVTVPATVKRIVGFSSVINSDSRGTNGGGLRLIVEAGSPDPLVIEQFGYGVKVDHRGPRTVIVKHGQYRYQNGPGSGDVVFEDVVLNPQVFTAPKRVWARQLNIETIGGRTAKIDNRGAQVWVLGFKTEGGGPIFTTSAGGSTELLGGFMLPNVAETEFPAFTCDNARMSLSYRYEAYDAGGVNRKHTVQYREIRNGTTRDLRTDVDLPRRIGLIACGNG